MSAPTDAQRDAVAHEARRIGYAHLAYVYGDAGPEAYDCSGLFVWCWRQKAGVTLPHQSGQILVDPKVRAVEPSAKAWAAMLPGDVVGYYGTKPALCTHVAMYLEQYDGMRIVAQAGDPQLGTEVIRAGKYAAPAFLGYVLH